MCSRPAPTGDRIHHHFWRVESQDRIAVTAETVSARGPALVFCRTKRGADRLSQRLAGAGLQSAAIHGDRSQGQRDRASGRLPVRATRCPRRHRRRRPGHPRGRGASRGPLRPAGRPHGLCAPCRPNRESRCRRERRFPDHSRATVEDRAPAAKSGHLGPDHPAGRSLAGRGPSSLWFPSRAGRPTDEAARCGLRRATTPGTRPSGQGEADLRFAPAQPSYNPLSSRQEPPLALDMIIRGAAVSLNFSRTCSNENRSST